MSTCHLACNLQTACPVPTTLVHRCASTRRQTVRRRELVQEVVQLHCGGVPRLGGGGSPQDHQVPANLTTTTTTAFSPPFVFVIVSLFPPSAVDGETRERESECAAVEGGRVVRRGEKQSRCNPAPSAVAMARG